MRDSVQQCKMRDISCVEVSSSTRLGVSNFNQVYEDILNEKYRIVFCAPEQIETPAFRDLLTQLY